MNPKYESRNPEQKESRGKMGIKEELASGQAELIQAEFDRSDNPWFACVNTRLGILMGNLGLMEMEHAITDSDYRILMGKVEKLTRGVARDLSGFLEKNPLPPEEIREKIISELKSIAEEIVARSEGSYVALAQEEDSRAE